MSNIGKPIVSVCYINTGVFEVHTDIITEEYSTFINAIPKSGNINYYGKEEIGKIRHSETFNGLYIIEINGDISEMKERIRHWLKNRLLDQLTKLMKAE